MTKGGPGLVAVGHDGGDAAVWVSSDGLSWMQVPHYEAVFGGEIPQRMTAVTVGGPGLVAVGNVGLSMAVWNSVDGIEWRRVPHDETAFPVGTQATSVVAGGPGLVAVGAHADPNSDFDAAVWTSSDGLT